MSVPQRPSRFQQQGPASRCVFHGVQLGWLSCTCYAVAMGIDKATLGTITPTGCDVRVSTNDTVGGTTLPQCAPYAEKCGAPMTLHVGSGVAEPVFLAKQGQAGRGQVWQGNTKPLLPTAFQSTGTAVNHAVYVNEFRGGSVGYPKEALVFDPAADGRTAGWGKADQGPTWWPFTLLVEFGLALHPWGEGDPRTLKNQGIEGIYSGVFPDTEPHAHLKFGAVHTPKFPDRTRVAVEDVWLHSRPSYGRQYRTRKLYKGNLFEAFQTVTRSGVVWYGLHEGEEWVPRSRLRYVGGDT